MKKIKEEDWDFLILLSYLDIFNERLKKRIEQVLKSLISAVNPSGDNLSELFNDTNRI